MQKKLEELKKQREMAKELYLKCQGAIELIESMIKEENEQKDKKK